VPRAPQRGAEKIALRRSIVKIPDNLDFDRAPGIIIIYGAACIGSKSRRLKAGETMAGLARRGTGLPSCRSWQSHGLKWIAGASSD